MKLGDLVSRRGDTSGAVGTVVAVLGFEVVRVRWWPGFDDLIRAEELERRARQLYE